MSSFKILICKDNKNVVLNGKFKDYNHYNELKEKLIQNSQRPPFLEENLNLKNNEKFKIVFIREKQKDIFFPEELHDSIWDEATFIFLKKKLLIRGIKDVKYRFFLERVENYPKWKEKKKTEILNDALDKYWEEAYEDIINGLSITLLEKRRNEFKVLEEEGQNEIKQDNIINENHKDVICGNCLKKDFFGKRFICSECNNYNLCQDCEKLLNIKQIHQREHVFIQINNNLNKINILNYNNIIGNYKMEFQNISTNNFDLELTIVNNGEADLENCYILPIRYGDEYLDCIPKIINQPIKTGISKKIILTILKPDIAIEDLKGYFRMFTPEGLPFGNVIFIKVLKNS